MKVMPATKWRGRFVVGGIAAMTAVSFNRHGVKFREAGEGNAPDDLGNCGRGKPLTAVSGTCHVHAEGC
jgi:hypothetical protein